MPIWCLCCVTIYYMDEELEVTGFDVLRFGGRGVSIEEDIDYGVIPTLDRSYRTYLVEPSLVKTEE